MHTAVGGVVGSVCLWQASWMPGGVTAPAWSQHLRLNLDSTTCYVTLGKFLHDSVPRLPYLQNGDTNGMCLTEALTNEKSHTVLCQLWPTAKSVAVAACCLLPLLKGWLPFSF